MNASGRRSATVFFAFSLVALAGFGCEPAPEAASRAERPRLVLLYVPCTVNAAELGPYSRSATDGARRYTPALDRMAARSVVFDRHYSEAGLSGIAYASIFSGTDARSHGVVAHPRPIEASLELIAELFTANGYESFYYDFQAMASARLGYAQGVAAERVLPRIPLAGDADFERILERLRADPSYRAFVQVAMSVTHKPYEGFADVDRLCALDPERCRFEGREIDRRLPSYALVVQLEALNAMSMDFPNTVERLGLSPSEVAAFARESLLLYRASLAHLDRIFGALVERIESSGLLPESLLVFTADHGEALDTERSLFPFTHGFELSPEVLRVPLVIQGTGLGLQPRRIEAATSSVDLLPTLAGLAGLAIEPDPRRTGEDLSQALLAGLPLPARPVFSHTGMLAPRMATGVARWKQFRRFHPRMERGLLWFSMQQGSDMLQYRNEGEERFGFRALDLSAANPERVDFDPRRPADAARARLLLRYREAFLAGTTGRIEPEPELPADEEARLLRALGYIE